MLVRWLTVAAAAVLLVACDASSFTADDLPGLVLPPYEAPAGTTYFDQGSGPAGIDAFAQGVDRARAEFGELEIRGGYTARFVSPNGAVEINDGVLAFRDTAAARRALEVERSAVIPGVTSGRRTLVAPGLGDEGFGFGFDSGPLKKPGTIYVFRIGNAMFVVSGSGPVTVDDVLATARSVAARAERNR